MKTLTHLKRCAVAAALAGSAVAASAATLEYQVITPFVPVPFSTLPDLPKFDPTLGTLTGVQLSWRSTRKTDGIVNYNPAAGPGSVTWAQVGTTVQVTAPGLISVKINAGGEGTVWPGSEGCSGAVADTAASLELSACSQNFSRISTVTSVDLIDSANWSLYTGTGDFDLTLDATTLLSDPVVTGAGFVNAFWSSTADFSVKVIYDYREAPGKVPEPGVLALLAVAAGAFGVARRRKA